MNKTISIFGWDVEEQVMTTLIFRMKTSCTPSDLHKRMCIGFGDSMLEITELLSRLTVSWIVLLDCRFYWPHLSRERPQSSGTPLGATTTLKYWSAHTPQT